MGGSDDPNEQSVVWVAESAALAACADVLGAAFRVEWVSAAPPLLLRLDLAGPPALLLLDGRMADGEAFVRALRHKWSVVDLPLLVVSPPAAALPAARWLEAGANDHLTEPLAAAELRARAAHLVRLRRLNAAGSPPQPARRDAWYRALIESFPNGGVFLFDGDLRFVIADGQGLRDADLPSADVVGRRLHEVLPPPLAAELEPHYRAALAGESHTFELAAAGRLHRTLTAPVRDSHGQVVAGLAMSQDVTREHEAEKALRRSQEELQETIEKLPTALALRRDDQLLWVNPAWMAMVGCERREECVGKSLLEFVHADDRARLTARLGDGDAPVEALRFRRQDGQIARLELSEIHAIRFQGAPAVLLVARDVTEQERLESRLRLADRMASVGTLAAGVAHEINNPLSYVLANVRLARERLDEIVAGLHEASPRDAMAAEIVCALECGEVRDALADACTGAERVGQIVRDLKTFSRADEERRDVLDVRSVLEAAINMAWNEIRHRAQLVRAFAPTPAVDANDARLGQVFLNLLVNAAQAIPEGHAHENRVVVRTGTSDDGGAFVEVGDTGSGIAPEHLSRVFDPFFTTKSPGVGTGLGLSICHGIIAGYGGRIEVESTPGQGSTFRVLLPAAARGPASVEPPRPTRADPGARAKILIIDDDVGVGNAMRRMLGRQHEVQTVMSAADALARLAREHFDVIFCDLMMPTMSGMDLYDTLAARDRGLVDKFVFMTGGAFTPRAREFLDRVPNSRVDKPFDQQQLRAIISGLVRPAPPQS